VVAVASAVAALAAVEQEAAGKRFYTMKKQRNDNTSTLTYAAAYAELQHIVQQMQADEVNVDDLLVLTARATELITWCRERLRQVEASLTDHSSTGQP